MTTARGSRLARRLTSRGARRLVFWLYTAALFTATHWPKAKIPGPPNTDKVLHVAVFGLWTVLFALAGYFRPVRRPAALLAIGLIAAAWTGIDELLQEIPFIHRHATIKDYIANLIGVGAGLVVAAIVGPLVEAAELDPDKPPDLGGKVDEKPAHIESTATPRQR